jgi:transposase
MAACKERLERFTTEQLIAIIMDLRRRVADLEAEVARLRKDSSNSSKPPSSDIVKPPKPPDGKGAGKIGGQPGHPRHEREPFGPDEIDRIENLDIERCPDCGGRVKRASVAARVIQRVELVQRPVEVVEYRSGGFLCLRCGKIHYATAPAGGLFGPRLTALVAYLKGACHASFSTTAKFCRDALCVTVSRGQLAKIIHKAGEAMSPAYDDLRRGLPMEKVLNVDETGHKDTGKGYWTWCFRAGLYTLFRIDPSRGSEVLVLTLGGQYEGTLGCDYFSAYRKYMGEFNVQVQFCLAHLIRDVKFLTTHPDRVTAAYGQRVLDGLRRLFHVIHRREKMGETRFQRALEKARRELIAVGKRAPERSEARNMADRFRRHGKAYFQFMTTPGVEPTNNLAEQAIRFVVIDRHVTQGTRGERGRRWCERIWTAIATCHQQDRSVFEYLSQTISAHFAGRPTPSLLPTGP